MSEINTAGEKVIPFIDMCPYCQLTTAGNHQLNCPSFIWNKEDIEMAEMGMDEYNKNLLEEDKA